MTIAMHERLHLTQSFTADGKITWVISFAGAH